MTHLLHHTIFTWALQCEAGGLNNSLKIVWITLNLSQLVALRRNCKMRSAKRDSRTMDCCSMWPDLFSEFGPPQSRERSWVFYEEEDGRRLFCVYLRKSLFLPKTVDFVLNVLSDFTSANQDFKCPWWTKPESISILAPF